MGAGAFGVQATAETYFGKSARAINLSETAMLAGLFKAPTNYSPFVNLPAAQARANDVLSNLVDAGFMTQGQVYAARRSPATPIDRSGDNAPVSSRDWYLRRQARPRANSCRAHGLGPGAAVQGRDHHRDDAAR
jgi:penicillin-binding protein 1A